MTSSLSHGFELLKVAKPHYIVRPDFGSSNYDPILPGCNTGVDKPYDVHS